MGRPLKMSLPSSTSVDAGVPTLSFRAIFEITRNANVAAQSSAYQSA